VAAAVDQLNAYGEVDVIVIARGGGSLEELWAFNEEVVARSIARSEIPVVTGIGHETDFTIADFVADVRASTPTAAAMAAVPDAAVWRDGLAEVQNRLRYLIDMRLQAERQRISAASRRLERSSPERILAAARQHIDESSHRLEATLLHLVQLRKEQLRGSALRLHSLSPLLTIGRGFAVVRRSSDGGRVTSIADVVPGQGLTIRVADGQFAATAGPRLESSQPDVTGAPDKATAEPPDRQSSDVKRPGGIHGH
jgi:exodeoxyribonuclease VII large subunit